MWLPLIALGKRLLFKENSSVANLFDTMLYTGQVRPHFILAFITIAFSNSMVHADLKLVSILKLKHEMSLEELKGIIGVEYNVSQQRGSSYRFEITLLKNNTFVKDHSESMDILKVRIEKSTAVEYLRSTRSCPPIKELFDYRVLVNQKPKDFSISCVETVSEGAHWNEQELHYHLDNYYIGEIKTIRFSTVDDVKRFFKILSLVHSITESELPLIADKYSNLALFEWDSLDILRHSLTNNALIALDESLLKINLSENNYAEAIYPNLAIRVEKIGETNSEGIMFVDANSSRNKSELVAVLKNTSRDDIIFSSPR